MYLKDDTNNENRKDLTVERDRQQRNDVRQHAKRHRDGNFLFHVLAPQKNVTETKNDEGKIGSP
jgi:hypothetical protein